MAGAARKRTPARGRDCAGGAGDREGRLVNANANGWYVNVNVDGYAEADGYVGSGGATGAGAGAGKGKGRRMQRRAHAGGGSLYERVSGMTSCCLQSWCFGHLHWGCSCPGRKGEVGRQITITNPALSQRRDIQGGYWETEIAMRTPFLLYVCILVLCYVYSRASYCDAM